MDTIREWAAALCAVVVLCCAANLSAPEGKNSRMLRAVLSLVMLCTLISPLGEIKSCRLEVDRLEQKLSSSEDRLMCTVEQQTCDMINWSLTDLIEDELYSIDIIPEKIYIDMDISEDGCISIGQVTVTVKNSDAARCGRIEETLRGRLGLDVQTLIPEDEQWS